MPMACLFLLDIRGRNVALGSIEFRKVVEALGHVRMLESQSPFPDRQRALIERLGLGVPALGKAQCG